MRKRASRVFVDGRGSSTRARVWRELGAGKHGLDSLTAIIDYVKYQSTVNLGRAGPRAPVDKWRSFGFATREVDGPTWARCERLLRAGPTGRAAQRWCVTRPRARVPDAENNADWHHRTSSRPASWLRSLVPGEAWMRRPVSIWCTHSPSATNACLHRLDPGPHPDAMAKEFPDASSSRDSRRMSSACRPAWRWKATSVRQHHRHVPHCAAATSRWRWMCACTSCRCG
jgi:hypothetical protein